MKRKSSKKKDARDRKRAKEIAEESEDETRGRCRENLWMAFLPSAEKRLSPVELDELDLRDKDFVTGKTEEGIAEYLKSGPWQTICSKLESAEKGSPFLLIICASAQRAVDLIRKLAPLQEKTKIAKLFAKHFKIEAQVSYLASHTCNIAVGTPNRIFHLIQKDGLKVNCLKYFIIDWAWQDKKQRTIAKIPELMQDLAVLLSSHILPLAKRNQVQIGLY